MSKGVKGVLIIILLQLAAGIAAHGAAHGAQALTPGALRPPSAFGSLRPPDVESGDDSLPADVLASSSGSETVSVSLSGPKGQSRPAEIEPTASDAAADEMWEPRPSRTMSAKFDPFFGEKPILSPTFGELQVRRPPIGSSASTLADLQLPQPAPPLPALTATTPARARRLTRALLRQPKPPQPKLPDVHARILPGPSSGKTATLTAGPYGFELVGVMDEDEAELRTLSIPSPSTILPLPDEEDEPEVESTSPVFNEKNYDPFPRTTLEMDEAQRIAMEPYPNYDMLPLFEKAELYGQQFHYMYDREPNFSPKTLAEIEKSLAIRRTREELYVEPKEEESMLERPLVIGPSGGLEFMPDEEVYESDVKMENFRAKLGAPEIDKPGISSKRAVFGRRRIPRPRKPSMDMKPSEPAPQQTHENQ